MKQEEGSPSSNPSSPCCVHRMSISAGFYAETGLILNDEYIFVLLFPAKPDSIPTLSKPTALI